jgi:hypothetical protein
MHDINKSNPVYSMDHFPSTSLYSLVCAENKGSQRTMDIVTGITLAGLWFGAYGGDSTLTQSNGMLVTVLRKVSASW